MKANSNIKPKVLSGSFRFYSPLLSFYLKSYFKSISSALFSIHWSVCSKRIYFSVKCKMSVAKKIKTQRILFSNNHMKSFWSVSSQVWMLHKKKWRTLMEKGTHSMWNAIKMSFIKVWKVLKGCCYVSLLNHAIQKRNDYFSWNFIYWRKLTL